MSFADWDPSHSVGNREIDKQHLALFELINRLHEGSIRGMSPAELEEVFDFLVLHSRIHFIFEEKVMAVAAYPGYEKHRQQHLDFGQGVIQLKAKFVSGSKNSINEILEFLKNWTINHILVEDKKFQEFEVNRNK